MKGIAPREIKIQAIYKGIIPFVILQALGVVTVLAFPDVALSLMHYVHG
jgi:TRAP-type mannitol/chloroaromatic compound transport system permease large subunit